MSENLPDYTELNKSERADVLHNLAEAAIDIVANHPDTRLADVEIMLRPKPYGYIAWLAISHAIKEKILIANNDSPCVTLRVA